MSDIFGGITMGHKEFPATKLKGTFLDGIVADIFSFQIKIIFA